MIIMNIKQMSNIAIAEELGKRLRARRLHLNLTRNDLMAQSDLALNTLKNLEQGKGTINSLLTLLRHLDLLDQLDYLVPNSPVSPMQLLRQPKPRQRARKIKDE